MRNIFTTAGAVVVWFSLLFSSLNEANAQANPVDPLTAAALQTKLDNLAANNNLKGLSASVIIPGKGTWNGVSGISHATVPIDSAMVFGFASMTKTFTAAAIMLLQEDGLLSINDSLHEFLPPYPNIDSAITIKQLLQHTSGIYNFFESLPWNNTINSNPTQALLPQFVLNNYVNAPYFAPGASHYYSNTNFLLLGLIIEQVTGQSYASFIRQRLLDPLQLTSLFVREHETATGVFPHNWWGALSGPWNDSYTMPMTSLFGTSAAEAAMAGNAYDLARWGQLLFTGQAVQDSSLQQMKQFWAYNGGLFTGYGLGLMRFGTGNTKAWGHNGNIRGFSGCFLFSPADSIVVSLLCNRSSAGHPYAWELLAVARQQQVTAAPGEVTGVRDGLVCYPNPVQGKGSIRYSLRKAQPVEITLQNSLGQTVKTLLREPQSAGEHSLTVDTKTLASGLYFCTLQTADSKLTQRWVITQ
jgi:D-alanyl-D-alanine carboxypeptidase